MKELLIKLEQALRAKRPKVARALRPGLSEAQITAVLNRAKPSRKIDAAVGFYSWKDGADTAQAQESFFPNSIYQFLPLEAAVEHCANLQKAVQVLTELGGPVEMPNEPERYLPAFWDGATGYLALDLKQGMSNRVMEIEFESEEPFREVCDSFEAFLAEATRAIQENETPRFLT